MSCEKTFSENMDILREGIMKAIEMAKPRGWHTWNSFAGCQEYHEQSMREAQKESVRTFLTMVFDDNTDSTLHTKG